MADNQEKNNTETTNNTYYTMNDIDEEDLFDINDEAEEEYAGTSSIYIPTAQSTVPTGDEEASNMANAGQYNYNQSQSTEMQSINAYYAEWSNAHDLYSLMLQAEEACRPSRSLPTPTPPQAFGLNVDREEPTPEEEDMSELVNAFDKIGVSKAVVSPNKEDNVPKKEDTEDNNDPDKPATSKTQEWIWETEQMLEDEDTYPLPDDNNSYSP